MADGAIRGLLKKSDMILMGVCVLLAAGFIVLAGKSAADAGSFLTIDNLFFIAVCLLLALTFIAVPALTMRERGINPFAVGDEINPARAAEHVHFEGGTRLFLNVLLGLLGLTVFEVFLAYIKIHDLRIFLTILIGLSLIKAALIVAYFMHLRFERMSLALTIVPTLVICICLLFIVFPDSFRALKIRTTRPSAEPAAAESTVPGHE
ncbi:MAG: cytochrome c oxidase subunit [Acidobacteriota bacterium]|jgi:cytochrome c oxidase subunit 4|nr:cytochrome c oxidase subunit [Acidobacteriota bacterium]MDT5262937.1 cytochrome c oxidase subunit [Acidobacteriota bacterium]MDT7780468.1 cytochrome c oxidase subunit [Acidobacteriota bacterium]